MAREWGLRGDELARASYAVGEPTSWFDRLYAEGADGTTEMPWDHSEPHPLLAEWVRGRAHDDRAGRAVVVGAGLGADAEFLASLGYRTAAFDVARTAVWLARERHPGTSVDYRVADLLDLPADMRLAFDLVVEIFTLQALPDPPRADAAAGVASLVRPGGTLLLVAFRQDGTSPSGQGPPFALSRNDLLSLTRHGVEPVTQEERPGPLWRAEFQRPA